MIPANALGGCLHTLYNLLRRRNTAFEHRGYVDSILQMQMHEQSSRVDYSLPSFTLTVPPYAKLRRSRSKITLHLHLDFSRECIRIPEPSLNEDARNNCFSSINVVDTVKLSSEILRGTVY